MSKVKVYSLRLTVAEDERLKAIADDLCTSRATVLRLLIKHADRVFGGAYLKVGLEEVEWEDKKPE